MPGLHARCRLSIGSHPGGICIALAHLFPCEQLSQCSSRWRQEWEGAAVPLGSRGMQRPGCCAGLARTSGGHDISGSRFGVGRTLPLRADSATPTACALRVRASPSLRPTPPASVEIASTNGGRHGCQSVFAIGRAVACPSIAAPSISGVPLRAYFCCRMARTAGSARVDAR